MSQQEDLDFIEQKYRVNIDVSDESGCTEVYTYTGDGDRLGFTFFTMDPCLDDVVVVASAINTLRNSANKRPRVGKVVSV